MLAGGTAVCWGRWDGQLLEVTTPVQGLSSIAELAIGHDVLEGAQQRYSDLFCVRDPRGAVRCWGNGHQGQLGAGGGDSSDVPVAIEPLPPAAQLALGSHHACALTTGGEVLCWGSNEYGQLGIGAGQAVVRRPAKVPLPSKVTQLVASSMGSCALDDHREVYCWGENLRGEAGAPNRTTRIAWTPHRVEFAAGSDALAASDSTTCALAHAGKIVCWGYVTDKLGPAFDAATSGELPDIEDGTAIAVGYSHVCAIRKDATLWCAGKADASQLGSPGPDAWRPRQVALPGAVAQVAADKRDTCARLADRRWYCWGANRGGSIGPVGSSPIATPALLDLSLVEP